MNCMKCGVEIKDLGVFCESCQEDMKKYPVKPNITVQIPRRPVTAAPRKKTRKQRYVKPEEQIQHLKHVRNWLCVLLVVSLLAFAASAAMTLQLLNQEDTPGIGQNYDTIESTDSQ